MENKPYGLHARLPEHLINFKPTQPSDHLNSSFTDDSSFADDEIQPEQNTVNNYR